MEDKTIKQLEKELDAIDKSIASIDKQISEVDKSIKAMSSRKTPDNIQKITPEQK